MLIQCHSHFNAIHNSSSYILERNGSRAHTGVLLLKTNGNHTWSVMATLDLGLSDPKPCGEWIKFTGLPRRMTINGSSTVVGWYDNIASNQWRVLSGFGFPPSLRMQCKLVPLVTWKLECDVVLILFWPLSRNFALRLTTTKKIPAYEQCYNGQGFLLSQQHPNTPTRKRPGIPERVRKRRPPTIGRHFHTPRFDWLKGAWWPSLPNETEHLCCNYLVWYTSYRGCRKMCTFITHGAPQLRCVNT